MHIITLMTDFGFKDNFVGVMKGVIFGINPSARVVDICHEILPQDIMGAAIALKTSYKYFPKDTVHVVVIDPGVGSGRLPILVKTKEYYFIGPDNGVLSLALEEEKIEGIICLNNHEFNLMPISGTFHGRDIFAPVAAYLSKGISYQLFGKGVKKYKKIELPKPKLSKRRISGEVIYMDRFGNLFTNITEDLKGKIKNPTVRIRNKTMKGIKKSYASAKPNTLVAVWDSSRFMEVAVNLGSAQNKLGANIGDKVEVINS
ncbi:MAG: SAM-dependent chlorinase/fluorinase [Candidatus Omnitrophica bacterium]|nr:SAM-dependent chlorinase/fluorinase [Candidatus Omnitrophota bacterium]